VRASLDSAEKQFQQGGEPAEARVRKILALAQSNYEVQFDPDSRLSERILFPATPSQSNGIEDARFVRFQVEAGPACY
jgi:hypothetical protein